MLVAGRTLLLREAVGDTLRTRTQQREHEYDSGELPHFSSVPG